MLQTGIKTIAVAAIATCVAIGVHCRVNGIRSFDDYRNFRAMRSVSDPIVVALADQSITAGSTISELLAIDTPTWTEDFGRCVVYGFTPKRSFDYQTVEAVDGHVVSARVGSCTWRWTFFDNTPDGISSSVASVRSLRKTIDQMPAYATIIQPLLDAELVSLGAAPTKPRTEAEQKNPPERRH